MAFELRLRVVPFYVGKLGSNWSDFLVATFFASPFCLNRSHWGSSCRSSCRMTGWKEKLSNHQRAWFPKIQPRLIRSNMAGNPPNLAKVFFMIFLLKPTSYSGFSSLQPAMMTPKGTLLAQRHVSDWLPNVVASDHAPSPLDRRQLEHQGAG